MLQTSTSNRKVLSIFARRMQYPASIKQQRFVFNALWELPIGDEEERGGMSEQNTGWLTQAFSHIEVAPILTLGVAGL